MIFLCVCVYINKLYVYIKKYCEIKDDVVVDR